MHSGWIPIGTAVFVALVALCAMSIFGWFSNKSASILKADGTAATTIFDFTVDFMGKSVALSTLKDPSRKAFLVVNMASK